jgi:hypothetical protein
MKTKILVAASALALLAGCTGENYAGSSLLQSEGAYANPAQVPAELRLPGTNIRTSGIPGESGFGGASSALSGSGSAGGGGTR